MPAAVPTSVRRPEDAAFHVNEALTNLYVSLNRELPGEHLSATRFIQGYALDQVLAFLDRLESHATADLVHPAMTLAIRDLAS